MNKKIIWIKTKCSDYYAFVKKVQFLKVNILDIKYNKRILYLKILADDFEKFQKYLVSFKFKKVSNTGLSLLLDKLKSNYILVSTFVIGLIIFLVFKNMIVEVNIIHENSEIRELLKEELDSYGIKVLHFKKSYSELDKIRQEILDKYPDKLDWMEFDVDGMIVNVRVEERIITDINKVNKTCDLVATKAGVISDILVFDGEAKVMINDYVREGDTLISGVIKYNEEDKRCTCASGEVYATVWYTASVSIPLEYNEYQETGKKKYNLVWENNGVKKNILRSRFENYNSSLKNILHVFDFNLYLETEMETIKKTLTYTEEEALNEGINKAMDSVSKKLSEFDTIIDKKVLKKSINDSTMDIEVFIIVRELISMEKEIVIDNTTEGN